MTALHAFHGGLRLLGHKDLAARPLQPCALPPQLVLPLLQHVGVAADPVVAAGQDVRAGERLAVAGEPGAVPLHAPVGARVLAIEPRPLPHPSGASGPCVILAPHPGSADAADADAERAPTLDWQTAPRDTLLARIADAGIVGLGGAAFPTAAKIEVPRRVLILNGAECEPYIACDQRLLVERAAEVVAGGRVLGRVTGADRIVLAIEDSMLDALAAARSACAGVDAIDVVAVPTIYPAGGERQLIRVLTGREVPRGGLPRDIGVVVQNVATAAAVWDAVHHGRPLTSRIVTVTGRGVRRPGNFIVPLGTPIAHLIEQAGGYGDDAARLLIGGPLMGLALPHDDFPIVKGSNCVLVLAADEVRDPAAAMPCIRCGECARVCPAQLLPQQLLAFGAGEQWARLADHGLFDCIECGCCDLACPSHIPLVEQFRFAKSELRWRDHEAAAAAAARERFDARQARLQREAQARAERQAARKAATGDAVAAALAKARARSGGDST